MDRDFDTERIVDMSNKWGKSIASIALSFAIMISEVPFSGTYTYAAEVPEVTTESVTEAEELVQTTENTETIEVTETEESEATETTEVTEATETTETEETEVTETTETEETEATETTETEETEVTETTETEATEATETTETEETEATETEETEETEDTELSDVKVEKKSKSASSLAADTIPINGTAITYTASSTDAAYFEINVTKKGYLYITAMANTDSEKCGSYLIVNSDLTTLTDSYSLAYNTASNSDKIGVEPGTYYVVYTKTGSDKVSVQFKCNFTASDYWESEANDTFATADSISCNKTYYGNTLVGLSGTTGAQEDYYKFTTSKNGAVSISFMHDTYEQSEAYYVVYLYDSDYNAVTSFTVKGGSKTTSSAQIGLVAGTYYVRVHGNALAYAENCEYSFKAAYTASEYWERENNETITAATQISLNQTYNGSLKSSDDVDFYQVKLTKKGYVNLVFGHELLANVSDNYYHVYLYGDDGSTLYSEFDSVGNAVSYTDTKIGLEAGTYYIKVVYKAYYDDGTYSLQVKFKSASNWETESNDNVNLADKISLDKWYNGALSSSSDVDYYKFTISESGYSTISLKHTNLADSNTYYYVYLYDSSFTQLTVLSSTGFEESKALEKYGLGKGTYYLKVTALDTKNLATNYSNEPYAIKVSHKAVSNWETENNNKFNLADKVKLGTPISGITTDGDTDIYKFTISEKTWINIAFSHASTGSTEKQWHVRLYDSLGNTVYYDARNKNVNAYMYVQGTSTYNSLSGMQLSAGTYYIKVCNWVGYSETPYKLSVSKVNIKAPKLKSVTATSYNKLKLTWKSVAGADSYLIYRSTSKDGTYKKLATVTGEKTSYTNSGLSCGKTYYYKIKAVGTGSKTKTSGYSNVVSGKPAPAKPSVTVASSKSKQVKVSWKKISGASGYEVYYSTKKNGSYKKAGTITKAKTVTYTQKKLKSGKTYYYKVRAYRTVNGKKVYGSYSTVKSVKVK